MGKLALGYQTVDGGIITDGRGLKGFQMKIVERKLECKPGMEDQCHQGILGAMKSVKYKVLLRQKHSNKCENSEGAQVLQLIREMFDDDGFLETSVTKGQVKIGFSLRCACQSCKSLTCHRNVKRAYQRGNQDWIRKTAFGELGVRVANGSSWRIDQVLD